MQGSFGFAHLIAQSDGAGKFVLALLLLMSVASWYLILVKSFSAVRMRWRARGFLKRFWQTPDLEAARRLLAGQGASDPFSRAAQAGFAASDLGLRRNATRLVEAGGAEKRLTRALRRAIERDTARLESGLTLLASVGSVAPFIGLFGTVWGVYHALVAIGLSGQGTLDKVAGPVGEALIMTGLGLAVAIPAVLAYNFFSRANSLLLGELDGFAHDIFAFLVTSVRDPNGAPAPAAERTVALRAAANRAGA